MLDFALLFFRELKLFFRELKLYFKRVIHPRRLIISSEKKVMQFPISVGLQLFVLVLFSSGIFWSSYATGRFIAARSTLEAQSNTIRYVTAKKLVGDNVVSPLLVSHDIMPSLSLSKESASQLMVLSEDKKKVAMLEKKVTDLKNTNEAIIERIRIKTDGHLDSLETIVNQTGLDPYSVTKQAEKSQKSGKQADKNTISDDAEGGPYIPSSIQLSEDVNEVFDSLDRLKTMRQIVSNLPLGIPIGNAQERSSFGHRIDPFHGDIAFHSGLDLAGAADSKIFSAADGVVTNADREGSYGNMVEIDHGFGVSTRYGHLSAIKVEKGDKIKKGQVIGIQGSTGRSTGPHLHYEVRYNGKAIDPQKFLQTGRLLELGSAISQN